MSAHVYIQAMNAFASNKHISMKTMLVQWRKVLHWLRRENTSKIRTTMTGVRYICVIPGHSIRPPSYLNLRVISSTIKRKWSATLDLRRITAWRMVYVQEEPAAEDVEKLVSPQPWIPKNQIRIRTQTIIKIPRISFDYFCLNTVVNQTMTEFTISTAEADVFPEKHQRHHSLWEHVTVLTRTGEYIERWELVHNKRFRSSSWTKSLWSSISGITIEAKPCKHLAGRRSGKSPWMWVKISQSQIWIVSSVYVDVCKLAGK